jgi:hypothetical protein
MGVVSTPCVSGVLLDEEDEEELDELEPVGCACSAGASASPLTSNTDAVDTISPCREILKII